MSNSVFQDRIKSNKLILCIIAIAIFVVDTLLAVLLAIGGELFSIGLPIFLIAILDIVLLLGVFFSNFRLKYSIVIPIIYMVLSSVIGVFLSSVLAKTVFTTIAFILSGIFRVLAIITLIFAIVNGANRGKGAKFFAFILSIILIGFSAFYVYNVLPNGYFGQGGVGVRNISYEYNQAKGGYVANLVAGNKGDKIIVANQFNGEKVVGVNSEIFSTKGVKEVELNCDTGFFIENETGLKNMDSSLVISVDKEKINEVRQYLYNKAQGQQANNYLNFANRITPNGLEKDEVYINFDYSLSDLQYAKYEVIDTWFGHKGDVFSLVEHAGSISYVGEYNLDDENFLKANYDRGGKVIDELTFNGQAIIGNAVEDNMPNTQIVFENVRRVYVQEDNDTKYNLTTEDKNFVKKDGLECRYVLQSDPFKMLSEIKDRVGFTVSFAYSKQNSSIKTNTTIEDFSKALTSDILVYPEWKLNAPKVSNIQGTKVYTYGDELNISATATHDIATGVTFEYAWTKSASTTILSTDNSYTKTNVKPLADTDVYKIAVTAKSSCTSLTSTAEVTTSVTVNKKQLNFTWDKSQTIYSGANQTITANYQASDVINNDTIQGYIAGESSVTNFTAVAKNAGKYDYA